MVIFKLVKLVSPWMRFAALMAVSGLLITSMRFITVNAVVSLGTVSNAQHKFKTPGVTDGVYDGVLMKMTDISYSNLGAYVGSTLGQLGSLPGINKRLPGIYKQIQKVDKLDWHLSYEQANQLFFSDLSNWKIIDVKNAESSDGFYGIAFEQGHTIVIAYRGTDDVQDLMSDADIYLKIHGDVDQLELAQQFASNVKRKIPCGSYNIIFTGHSIGGWLAQQLYLYESKQSPSWKSVSATVFNSIGTGFKSSSINRSSVKDYHFQGDIFGHFGTSLGQEIEVPNPTPNESIYDKHQMFNFYGYFYPYT